jgi:DUF4097 and DUF4098 domain-containing protein YvlB
MQTRFFASFFLGALALVAAGPGKSLSCDDRSNRDRPSYCEIREESLPATGNPISIDGKTNGGVSVKGWDQSNILVRSKVQASGESDAEARTRASQVRVNTGGGQIFAEGPQSHGKDWWAVSYEVFVPRQAMVSLKTHNGGVSIEGVQGRVDFEAMNGGANLRSLGGEVHGHTANGGLNIELDGNRWEGQGMDVRTTNGGVRLSIPENYSARLETGTTNGKVKVDYPLQVQGELGTELATTIGGGGALLRAVTTNGGVVISRR